MSVDGDGLKPFVIVLEAYANYSKQLLSAVDASDV